MGAERVQEPGPRVQLRRSADVERDDELALPRRAAGPAKLTRSAGHEVAAGARPVGKLTRSAAPDATTPEQAWQLSQWMLSEERGWSPVQRRATADGADPDQGSLASAFAFLAESGGPQALPAELARRLSKSLGLDASRVRIHTDDQAAAAAVQLHARAFTIGEDIYFAAGCYDPHSEAGLELLAHEVAHVAQHQRGALNGARGVSRPDDAHERQADELASRFLLQRHQRRAAQARAAQAGRTETERPAGARAAADEDVADLADTDDRWWGPSSGAAKGGDHHRGTRGNADEHDDDRWWGPSSAAANGGDHSAPPLRQVQLIAPPL
jgi:Domain of unknown function (DUF4157)